jgi:hypothetical protein
MVVWPAIRPGAKRTDEPLAGRSRALLGAKAEHATWLFQGESVQR